MAQSILIVKLSSMGDVLHTLPAAQALRLRFPHARLVWAVEHAHAELLARQPFLDDTIVWQRGQRGGFGDFVRRLRSERWDLAIDFQGLFRSGLVTRLSGARQRLGFQPARELAGIFYNRRHRLTTLDRHAVDRSLDLVASLGATMPGTPLDRPYVAHRPPTLTTPGHELFPLFPSMTDRRQVDDWRLQHRVDRNEKVVLLNPHCRRPANLWPIEHFVELARRLAKMVRVRVAIIGGAAARPLGDRIAEACPSVLRADGAFTLLGSAELISRSAVLVTGDTGPMHLAAAVGTPTVAMLGATNPVRTGPYASNAIVLHKHLPCSPCLAKTCPLKHEPPLCQQQITVDEVYNAVVSQLHFEPASFLRRSA